MATRINHCYTCSSLLNENGRCNICATMWHVTPRDQQVVAVEDPGVHWGGDKTDELGNQEHFYKFDGGKPPLHQLKHFRYALEGLATIAQHGAEKYGQDNWKLCTEPERYEGAALRHLFAYMEGEYMDPDSGHDHLYHALWNIAALIELEEL